MNKKVEVGIMYLWRNWGRSDLIGWWLVVYISQDKPEYFPS